jgi:hypothetical protein
LCDLAWSVSTLFANRCHIERQAGKLEMLLAAAVSGDDKVDFIATTLVTS